MPRDSLVTIFKSFIRPHLDYGDVNYDQPSNGSFTDKIEQLQCKACLAIIGAIQGTSRECLYNDLGLESLSSRRWCKKLCAIYTFLSSQCPEYLFDIMPSSESFCNTRMKQRPFFNCRLTVSNIPSFPNSLFEWSQLASEIQKPESNAVFKSKLFSFMIRPTKRSIFNVNGPEGVKYLTRLCLCFSDLNKRKFSHGFQDTLSPLCNCSLEVENNEHCFLRCLNFENARSSLFIDISSINSSFKNLSSHLKVALFLFGESELSAIDKNLTLKASIKYIMATNRLSVPLFLYCFLSLALNIYIHFFPPASSPFPTFFTVPFERAVRYALVLYFTVFFMVIFS